MNPGCECPCVAACRASKAFLAKLGDSLGIEVTDAEEVPLTARSCAPTKPYRKTRGNYPALYGGQESA